MEKRDPLTFGELKPDRDRVQLLTSQATFYGAIVADKALLIWSRCLHDILPNLILKTPSLLMDDF
jgi:hypothetical protein